jgi:hypothetical protein
MHTQRPGGTNRSVVAAGCGFAVPPVDRRMSIGTPADRLLAPGSETRKQNS